MIWPHETGSISITVYLVCSCFLTIVQLDDYADYDSDYDDKKAAKLKDPTSTISETIYKYDLSDVYFAPRWEGEGPPNFTDHPNKVTCNKDYWWRPYVERMDPPPEGAFARYLRWRRTSIDTSNVTTEANTANTFIGTYDPDYESADSEKPWDVHSIEIRSVRQDDISGSLELADSERENARSGHFREALKRKFKRQIPILSDSFGERKSTESVTEHFGTVACVKRTAPEAASEIYAPGRAKRGIKKKTKKAIKSSPQMKMSSSTTKRAISTTPPRRMFTFMDASKKAKLQKQIRETAVPNLRKFTTDDGEGLTTNPFDKLTALPFYSPTQAWATPTEKRPQFRFIKPEDAEYADGESYDSLEAGDQSISFSDPPTGKPPSNMILTKQSTPLLLTLAQAVDKKQQKTSSISISSSTGIISPGPDASENELRRYWWKMKQMKRGVNDEEENQRGKSKPMGRYLRKLKIKKPPRKNFR